MGYQKYTRQTALSVLLFQDVMVQLTVSHPILPTSSSLYLKNFHHTLRKQNTSSTSLKSFHHSQPMHSLSRLMSRPYTQNILHDDGISPVIHFMEKYKHPLPTNFPAPHIVRAILDSILKHSTFNFMDTHIHQILGTSMGWLSLCQSVHGQRGTYIILALFHLIYFMKYFIDIFYLSWFSHPARIFDCIYEYNKPYD